MGWLIDACSMLAQGSTKGLESSVVLAFFLLGLGLVFLLAELLFVSFGALTACSLACLASALWIAFNAGPGWGVAMIIIELILVPSLIVVGIKKIPGTRFGRRLMPDSPNLKDVTNTGVEGGLEALLGVEGETMSMCRPAGTAEIAGKRYDVVSESMMIAKGARVKVVDVEGNRVVVREIIDGEG
jgi:membrane-bound serine protease (ClpP class)